MLANKSHGRVQLKTSFILLLLCIFVFHTYAIKLPRKKLSTTKNTKINVVIKVVFILALCGATYGAVYSNKTSGRLMNINTVSAVPDVSSKVQPLPPEKTETEEDIVKLQKELAAERVKQAAKQQERKEQISKQRRAKKALRLARQAEKQQEAEQAAQRHAQEAEQAAQRRAQKLENEQAQRDLSQNRQRQQKRRKAHAEEQKIRAAEEQKIRAAEAQTRKSAEAILARQQAEQLRQHVRIQNQHRLVKELIGVLLDRLKSVTFSNINLPQFYNVEVPANLTLTEQNRHDVNQKLNTLGRALKQIQNWLTDIMSQQMLSHILSQYEVYHGSASMPESQIHSMLIAQYNLRDAELKKIAQISARNSLILQQYQAQNKIELEVYGRNFLRVQCQHIMSWISELANPIRKCMQYSVSALNKLYEHVQNIASIKLKDEVYAKDAMICQVFQRFSQLEMPNVRHMYALYAVEESVKVQTIASWAAERNQVISDINMLVANTYNSKIQRQERQNFCDGFCVEVEKMHDVHEIPAEFYNTWLQYSRDYAAWSITVVDISSELQRQKNQIIRSRSELACDMMPVWQAQHRHDIAVLNLRDSIATLLKTCESRGVQYVQRTELQQQNSAEILAKLPKLDALVKQSIYDVDEQLKNITILLHASISELQQKENCGFTALRRAIQDADEHKQELSALKQKLYQKYIVEENTSVPTLPAESYKWLTPDNQDKFKELAEQFSDFVNGLKDNIEDIQVRQMPSDDKVLQRYQLQCEQSLAQLQDYNDNVKTVHDRLVQCFIGVQPEVVNCITKHADLHADLYTAFMNYKVSCIKWVQSEKAKLEQYIAFVPSSST